MTAALSRQIRRLAERLEAARPTPMEAQQAAAYRIGHGKGDWDDYVQVSTGAESSRIALIGDLPLWVVLTKDYPDLPIGDPKTCIGLSMACPPDQRVPPPVQSILDRLKERWRTAENCEDALRWAELRLVLGVDGGRKVRRKCWTRVANGEWQLSDHVMSAQSAKASQLRHLVDQLYGGAIDEWLMPQVSSVWEELMEIRSFATPSAPHFQLTCEATPLELAVVIDGRPNPSWLSDLGRTVLLDQAGSPFADDTPTNACVDSASIVQERLVTKTLNRLHVSITARRQTLDAKRAMEMF